MSSTITAGNATNGLAIASDNTGILQLKTGTGAGTVALTLDASQNATFAGTVGATNLFGQGQTWQDVKASRALITTYVNTTGRPIFVAVSVTSTLQSLVYITVNGVSLYSGTMGATGLFLAATMIIPPGASYSAVCSSGTGTIQTWGELR